MRDVVFNLSKIPSADTSVTCGMSTSMTGRLTCCIVGDPTSGSSVFSTVPLVSIMAALLAFYFCYGPSACEDFLIGFTSRREDSLIDAC